MSDIVVQIIDSRNPLLYYCHDLFQYALELGKFKACVLIMNKIDLLTDFQR